MQSLIEDLSQTIQEIIISLQTDYSNKGILYGCPNFDTLPNYKNKGYEDKFLESMIQSVVNDMALPLHQLTMAILYYYEYLAIKTAKEILSEFDDEWQELAISSAFLIPNEKAHFKNGIYGEDIISLEEDFIKILKMRNQLVDFMYFFDIKPKNFSFLLSFYILNDIGEIQDINMNSVINSIDTGNNFRLHTEALASISKIYGLIVCLKVGNSEEREGINDYLEKIHFIKSVSSSLSASYAKMVFSR